jgi:hypothetical protein
MASVQKDPKTSGHSDAQAPTSGMWRNTNAPLNGSAPTNGGAK